MFKYTKPKDNRYQIAMVKGGKEVKEEVEADDIVYDILGIRKEGKGKWVLDHIPTGFAVGRFKSEANLRQAVRELLEVTDFKFIKPPKEIGPPVMEILKKYHPTKGETTLDQLQMNLAKSFCVCSHVGDGEHSEHGGMIGHGSCEAVLPSGFKCHCLKFTWARYMTPFEQQNYIRESILKSPKP